MLETQSCKQLVWSSGDEQSFNIIENKKIKLKLKNTNKTDHNDMPKGKNKLHNAS